jgi:light-regulated signal transduction histidine kinase (bacteriophytochrome)
MGRSEMLDSRVDLDELVSEVVREVRPEANGRSISWTIEPLPAVAGDRSMLRVALVNLLSNAVKYTRAREQAHIVVGAEPGDAGYVVVFVRDDGCGFDMQYAGRLFGVFQRLHRAEEFDGTGIGLAIVRRIAHRHGGRAWADAAPDSGATFYVSLPAAKGAA